jgi:hypothetical protein
MTRATRNAQRRGFMCGLLAAWGGIAASRGAWMLAVSLCAMSVAVYEWSTLRAIWTSREAR